MNRQIYLDNAATTMPDPAVVDMMIPYLRNNYGNPSSLYSLGQINKDAINFAREEVASVINANADDIFFTSGGSEANNWVLKGIARPGDHIITTKIEHHSVLNTCEFLDSIGVDITYLDVDKYGFVNPDDVRSAIKKNTVLISIMAANNEIGSIQPLEEIGRISDEANILFHTDAVQAFGHIPINVKTMNIDFLSCSAHKINGPKGVGALFASENGRRNLVQLIHGGGQESGMRASTENVAGIVGFGAAAKISQTSLDLNMSHERKLCRLLMSLLADEFHGVGFNGPAICKNRLPNNINISFPGVRGEELMMLLSLNGCYVSTGSACNSGDNKPSHVLKAIGLSDDEANSSIRVTVGKYTTEVDIIDFVQILKQCLEWLKDK